MIDRAPCVFALSGVAQQVDPAREQHEIQVPGAVHAPLVAGKEPGFIPHGVPFCVKHMCTHTNTYGTGNTHTPAPTCFLTACEYSYGNNNILKQHDSNPPL